MSESICPVCKETHKIEHISTEFKNEGEKVELLFKCENCGSTFTERYKMTKEAVNVQKRYYTVQELIDTLQEIPFHDRIHMPVMVYNEETSQLSKIHLVDTGLNTRVDLNISD